MIFNQIRDDLDKLVGKAAISFEINYEMTCSSFISQAQANVKKIIAVCRIYA